MATEAGLTFFDVVFEMLDAQSVNAIAAYGGFPVRYASWRFGMDFEKLAKGYDWGLSKIYELVINHDPTIAYLVRSNSHMEQKLVMAHVFGHADFFRNSAWFAPTDRRMVDRFERHARLIQEHTERYGQDRVERFLDDALSLQGLIDPYGPQRRLRHRESEPLGGLSPDEQRGTAGPGPLLEPPTAARQSLSERCRARLDDLQGEPSRTPLPTGVDLMALGEGESAFDILQLLCREGRVEPWQRDILRVVASEAEYFLPQRMTKIINEGWASFWHSRLLTGGLLDDSEIIEFADCHSGATAAAPGQLNPYKLGIDLFRYAEEIGLDIFRLRSIHNDVSFIDEVVDETFVARSKLFAMERDAAGGSGRVIGSRCAEEVKNRLLASLSWGGMPRIRIDEAIDGGALTLVHEHDGRDLRLDEAGAMLRTIGSIWGGPVVLVTQEGDEGRRLTCERGELSMREAAPLQ